jgi:hypothetical protein
MASKCTDVGFARHCISLIADIVVREEYVTEASHKDIVLALDYIVWMREMTPRLTLSPELCASIRCVKSMAFRLSGMCYHKRLDWFQQRTFCAQAVLRLLAKYVDRSGTHNLESRDTVRHILNYISYDDPQLLDYNAHGKLNPSYETFLWSYFRYTARLIKHERETAYYESLPQTPDDGGFSEILERVFCKHHDLDDSDTSPL